MSEIDQLRFVPRGYEIPAMTLRDYFAGQAISGIMTDDDWDENIVARSAYAIADAMLAEREKTTVSPKPLP